VRRKVASHCPQRAERFFPGTVKKGVGEKDSVIRGSMTTNGEGGPLGRTILPCHPRGAWEVQTAKASPKNVDIEPDQPFPPRKKGPQLQEGGGGIPEDWKKRSVQRSEKGASSISWGQSLPVKSRKHIREMVRSSTGTIARAERPRAGKS